MDNYFVKNEYGVYSPIIKITSDTDAEKFLDNVLEDVVKDYQYNEAYFIELEKNVNSKEYVEKAVEKKKKVVKETISDSTVPKFLTSLFGGAFGATGGAYIWTNFLELESSPCCFAFATGIICALSGSILVASNYSKVYDKQDFLSHLSITDKF